MNDNTCPAGNDVCKASLFSYIDGGESYCKGHTKYQWDQPHHTDGTPCGEGCERRVPPSPGIEEAVDTALEAERESLAQPSPYPSMETFTSKDTVFQEKPGSVGEVKLGLKIALDHAHYLVGVQERFPLKHASSPSLNPTCQWPGLHVTLAEQCIQQDTTIRALQVKCDELSAVFCDAHKPPYEQETGCPCCAAVQLSAQVGVLVEAITKSDEHGVYFCELCVRLHEPHPGRGHVKSCPLSNLPEAARERINENTRLREALESIEQAASPPAPRLAGWAVPALGTIIYITRTALHPKGKS